MLRQSCRCSPLLASVLLARYCGIVGQLQEVSLVTSRERFHATMRYGVPDRVPLFDEGFRDGVLEAWHAQGLAEDADLAEMFHFDRRERVPVDLGHRPGLQRWPTSRRGLKALRRRLDPDDPDRFPKDWQERVSAWRDRDHILELPVHRGLFLSLGVRDWARLEQLLFQLCDTPALVREMMDICGEFSARLADRILEQVEVDFVSFSEPIGGNDRPLLSPAMYEDVILASYRPVLDVVQRHGVETIVLITYANARVLVPSVIQAGFNCLWACETNAEAMDYRALRREFGRDLRLIGGVDLDTLLRSKAAVRREITTRVPALLAQGGFIPLADGRVRENIPFENYVYYRRLLEKVTRPLA